ncbi:hypothetical protein CAG64_05060 [Vibrio sp. V38_P2S17PM301]|nr:hypothetical protein [Vibrio sp. V38_P2S17PM301]
MWLWENYLQRNSCTATATDCELNLLAKILYEKRQIQSGFIISGVSESLVEDIAQHIILLGDSLYDRNISIVKEIKEIIIEHKELYNTNEQ